MRKPARSNNRKGFRNLPLKRSTYGLAFLHFTDDNAYYPRFGFSQLIARLSGSGFGRHLAIPTGLQSFSPGLPGLRGYPGYWRNIPINFEKVASRNRPPFSCKLSCRLRNSGSKLKLK
jgi:hypothetical protein